jgi:predicted HTH domain antitoxin
MELEQQHNTLLQEALQRLSRLSSQRLRVASEFLAYLAAKTENDATEALSIKLDGDDTAIIEQAKHRLHQLSFEQLSIASGFIAYLEQQDKIETKLRREKGFKTFVENQQWLQQLQEHKWPPLPKSVQMRERISNPELEIEFKFKVPIGEIPEIHRQEAERLAREAYVMTLLRHGDISSGRAAQLIGIPRVDLFDLMGAYGISPFPDQTREELEREVEQAMRILEKNQIIG